MKLNVQENTDQVEFLETRKDFKKYGLKRYFRFTTKNFKKDLLSKRVIRGYAGTTHKDRVDDIITLDAWKKSKNDLTRAGSKTVFYNHDRSKAIGLVTKTSVDDIGLFIEVKISTAKDVDDIWTKIKEGVLNSFSIGGRFKKVQVERDKEGRLVSYKILELELFEVSVVGIPANPKASITNVIEKRFKSFKPLVKGKTMKNKEKGEKVEKTAKVETKVETKVEKKVEETATPVTLKQVNDLIAAAIAPVVETMTKIGETIKTIAEAPKGEKVELKETSGAPEWAQNLQKQMEEISSKVNTVPSRKGVVKSDEEEEIEEEEVEEGGNPEKCLDPKDPNSAVFAKWAMENPEDGYNKLSEGEKVKCDNIYFSLMQKSRKVTKK